MAKHPKYIDTKVWQLAEAEKQVVAVKTARLRALRLTKEAADRDTASREIAASLPRSRGHKLNRSSAPQS
jgi:hypothetical protein